MDEVLVVGERGPRRGKPGWSNDCRPAAHWLARADFGALHV